MSEPAGSPLNESVRYEGGVATLISRTDPQGLRWSGCGGGETVTVSFLLIPFDDEEPTITPLVRGAWPGGMNLASILGSDRFTVWADAGELYDVRLADGALVTAQDWARANPQAQIPTGGKTAPAWPSARAGRILSGGTAARFSISTPRRCAPSRPRRAGRDARPPWPPGSGDLHGGGVCDGRWRMARHSHAGRTRGSLPAWSVGGGRGGRVGRQRQPLLDPRLRGALLRPHAGTIEPVSATSSVMGPGLSILCFLPP